MNETLIQITFGKLTRNVIHNLKLNMYFILNAYYIFCTSKYFMDNYDVISSLFYSYYFSHGKSNPRQTLMLIQLMTCVRPEYKTRP